jgi:perosamine synthetase
VKKPRIFYTKPSITEKEVSYAADAAKNGWGDQCYEYIDRFESLFKKHLGVGYAIATSSCTGALHMGLDALGIGNNDEVILADTNWIATAAPIVHLGAKPVFIDIDPDSWCIDPKLIERSITNKTKAIIAVHLYGNLCEMDQLLHIGNKYNIPVIEDAAEAIGSVYKGNRAGSMGRFGVFSFHGTKTLTTGEGGIFVTNNRELYENVLTLSNHGRSKSQIKQFWPDVIGFKYKMSNIQAAIGCAQMERIDELISRKREIFDFYRQEFDGYNEITINPEPEGMVNGAWMPTVLFEKSKKITREKIQKAFKKENIDARVFFWPLSALECFDSVPENYFSQDIPNRSINLPSYHDITKKEMLSVCMVIKTLLKES